MNNHGIPFFLPSSCWVNGVAPRRRGFSPRAGLPFLHLCGDELHRLLDQPAQVQVLHPHHDVVAVVYRDQDALCPALAHGCRHGGGDLPQQGVGDDDAQGPRDDIRPAAAHHHGVFSGGPPVRPRPEHGGGGGAVAPCRRNQKPRDALFHRRRQLPANAAPLGVDNQQLHPPPPPFSSRPFSSPNMARQRAVPVPVRKICSSTASASSLPAPSS